MTLQPLFWDGIIPPNNGAYYRVTEAGPKEKKEEHIFGYFALTTLTFRSCTSPNDTFHFTYLSPYATISIQDILNCSTIFQKTIYNNSNTLSTSSIILAEESVPPICESHILFSTRAIYLGVE